MTYYQHPEPERFVGRVREMAQAGMLHSNWPDTNVMFLGKVMEKNPAKIAAWLDALADLRMARLNSSRPRHRCSAMSQ